MDTSCLMIQSSTFRNVTTQTESTGLPQSVYQLPHAVYLRLKDLTLKELDTKVVGSHIMTSLIIRVNKEKLNLPTKSPDENSLFCEHVKGLAWKDIIDNIVAKHNETCKHTGFELSPDMLSVTMNESQNSTEIDDSLKSNLSPPKFKNSRHKPAQCLTCHKWFRSKWHLAKHTPLHSKKHNIHSCDRCDKVFKTKGHLENHKLRHEKPAHQMTGTCSVKESKECLNGKTSLTKSKSGFSCPECHTIFKSRYKLKRHVVTHMEKHGSFPCQHCSKICKTQWHLQKHQLVHVKNKPYKCDNCSASFGQKVEFQKHRTKVHNISEQHLCDICGAMYKNKTTLQDHMKEHSGKSYTCDVCQKMFSRPDIFRKHIAYHKYKKNPSAYPCNACDEAFPTKSILNVHVRKKHLQEKTHKCSVCAKAFFTRFEKTSHEGIHTDVLPFVCSCCNKAFRQKSSLILHVKSHTGHKTFTCQFCGKGFNQKSHLMRHEVVHTSSEERPRPFKCSICGQDFLDKSHCQVHEKRHEGIKDHKCSHCPAAFVAKGDLNRHLRTHTDGKLYHCLLCQVKFARKSELLEHQLIHGKIQNTA